MVVQESTQTRVVRKITDKMHPNNVFSSIKQSFYEENVGMHFVCYFPYYHRYYMLIPGLETNA